MRKKIVILTILIFNFTVIISPAFSQQENDVVIEKDIGFINYSNGRIYAYGHAKINAEQNKALAIRIATLDARRNLLEMIKPVPIDSYTQVNDLMSANDTIRSYVNGLITNAERVGEIRYLRIDGEVQRDTIEVTVRMPLPTKEILSAILPPSPLAPPAPTQTSPIYSGVVIDARNFPVKPAMAPKIIDEDGREVYGSAYVSKDWAVEHGMAGYTKSINEARANQRVAGNPMIIKGIRASGALGADIIISNEDARKIRNAASYQKFLDECRLMVVLKEIS